MTRDQLLVTEYLLAEKMIYLKSEPQGESYRTLVRFLAGYSNSFELVLRRKGCEPNEQARAVIAELHPFELSRGDATEWAGTRLGAGAGTAVVTRYRLTEESMAVLLKQDRLYAWCLPHLPEDLAVYTSDGSCFFSSTGHEREAMLRSGKVSGEEFATVNPGVKFTWYPGHRS